MTIYYVASMQAKYESGTKWFIAHGLASTADSSLSLREWVQTLRHDSATTEWLESVRLNGERRTGESMTFVQFTVSAKHLQGGKTVDYFDYVDRALCSDKTEGDRSGES